MRRTVSVGLWRRLRAGVQSAHSACELHSSNHISPAYVGRKGLLSGVVGGVVQMVGLRAKAGTSLLLASWMVDAGS